MFTIPLWWLIAYVCLFILSKGRRKPLAPTCNVCLIRNDLTTVWCEVTSSVRTRTLEEDEQGSIAATDKSKTAPPTSQGDLPQVATVGAVKELLLCLRPIRDGEEKADEKDRFVAKREVSDDNNTALSSSGEEEKSGQLSSSSSASGSNPAKAPPKKRKAEQENDPKKRGRGEDVSSGGSADTDVAESLVMMSSKK